jgi:hypothetical protein
LRANLPMAYCECLCRCQGGLFEGMRLVRERKEERYAVGREDDQRCSR